MRKSYFFINLILFCLWPYFSFCQTDCITSPPSPPELKTVSVQPETGNTEIIWKPSQSPDIAAYIVYTYKNGDGLAIDTLWDPSDTSYTYVSTASKYFSVSYVVTAMRLPRCTSPFSNVLNTVFCSSEIDTCKKQIVLNWNGYTDYPLQVLEYRILISENGAPLTERFSVNSNLRSFTFSEFATNSQYCFVVRAILEDGMVSGSNKSCLSTSMQRPPEWINADYATVNDENDIALSFKIDPLSEINQFSLEKKSGLSGEFQEIAQLVSADGFVLFTDNQADIGIVNYYRLSAINSCDLPVTASNISSNMVLSLERTGDDFILSWNSYREWLGMVSAYRLFISTGNDFQEKDLLPGTDSVFLLGYKEIMYDVTGSEVCFYISASETSNPYGVTGQSNSSRACTVPTEIITVPNVFTPNNDLVNDLFVPVLSFTPLDYHLIISDHHGSVLFETRDHMALWDGSQKGNPHPQGVCLWFLQVKTPSGKNISKTGTLTIIRDQ